MPMERTRVLILGAAGRDFHNFNVYYRGRRDAQVVAFTVIVLERRYPGMRPLGELLLWVVVIFALVSAVQYFWSFWKKLDVRVKKPLSPPLVVFRVGEKEQQGKDVAAQ